MNTPDYADALPPVIHELAVWIDYAAAITLAEKWPGQPLYIHEKPGPEHPISLAIGHAPALKLGKGMGRTQIIMPKLNRYYEAQRNQIIFQQLENKTASGTQLAQTYGLRTDSVYAIYAKMKKNDQGDLFQGMPE